MGVLLDYNPTTPPIWHKICYVFFSIRYRGWI